MFRLLSMFICIAACNIHIAHAYIYGATPNIYCTNNDCIKRCNNSPYFHINGNYCNTNDSSDESGVFAWEFTEDDYDDLGGDIPNGLTIDTDAYPPFTGEFVLKWYLCKTDSSGSTPCTVKKSNSNASTTTPMKLSSSKSLSENYYDAGGHMGALVMTSSGYYNWCATLVSIKDGHEYFVQGQGGFCQDQNPMPVDPSSCVINNGRALDIDFGVLDRNRDISHIIEGEVKKYDIPIVCTNDASMDVSVKFESNTGSISVGGYNVIGTNIPGLGVSVFYNHKIIDINDSKIEQSFSPGISNISLGFSVVADNAEHVAPGKFSASGTMIITRN